jgi:hypothetical protein
MCTGQEFRTFKFETPATIAAVAWTLPPMTPSSVIETVLSCPLDADVPTYNIFPFIAEVTHQQVLLQG